jgi:ABC-type cobalamin/Fe3+-siderophores transport system ATPase subunit
MTKLITIGGAPGVGKSTVAKILLNQMDNSVWLDGDDLWRMHPFVVDSIKEEMVEKNIQYVLQSFLETGFSFIIFSWVLHDNSIVKRILSTLGKFTFDLRLFTLLCDEDTLKSRITLDSSQTTDTELAIKRLKQ